MASSMGWWSVNVLGCVGEYGRMTIIKTYPLHFFTGREGNLGAVSPEELAVMRKRGLYRRRVGFTPDQTAALGGTTSTPPFSDPFDDNSLDGGWTQDTGAGGTIAEQNGRLELTLAGETDHTWPPGVSQGPVRLYQTLDTSSNITITAKGTLALPSTQFQGVGVFMKDASDRYWYTERFNNNGGIGRFGAYYDVSENQVHYTETDQDNPFWVRITKTAVAVQMYHSADGDTWFLSGQEVGNAGNIEQIGVYYSNVTDIDTSTSFVQDFVVS